MVRLRRSFHSESRRDAWLLALRRSGRYLILSSDAGFDEKMGMFWGYIWGERIFTAQDVKSRNLKRAARRERIRSQL